MASAYEPPYAAMAEALSGWFAFHQRALPWRQNRTPYRVWLSEIMLQQTQVATVIPYFEKFLQQFPTVESLAAADLDEVLALWTGLGYYRRGRNLHRAAVEVSARGEFPSTVEGLKTLPGVGDYTAGAIASFAFGLKTPLVDGNVQRVLSRLFVDDTPINSGRGRRVAWQRAQDFLQASQHGPTFNEAMMELGALVCTPRAPHCAACPLVAVCQADAQGTPEAWPVKLKKAARRSLHVATIVLKRDSALWLERAPEGGLFGDLWSPPTLEISGPKQSALGWTRLLNARNLLPPKSWPPCFEISRTLTHRDLRLHAICLPASRSPTGLGRWVDRQALARLGCSAATHALLDAVLPDFRIL